MAIGATIQGQLLPVVKEDFFSSVALGFSPHYSSERKFADREVIDAADGFVDIWNFQDVLTYTYSTTADIDSISSTSALDTQTLLVYGLDADYEPVQQLAVLNGQNRVALATPLMRMWRIQNANGTELAGEVFVYPETPLTGGKPTDVTKVRGYVAIGDNQTLMSQYTVPAGKTMLVTIVDTAFSKSQAATSVVKLYVRPVGGVPLITSKYAVHSQGSSQYNQNAPFPFIVPEKSDIIVQADSSANGAGLSISYQFILADNAYVANRKG